MGNTGHKWGKVCHSQNWIRFQPIYLFLTFANIFDSVQIILSCTFLLYTWNSDVPHAGLANSKWIVLQKNYVQNPAPHPEQLKVFSTSVWRRKNVMPATFKGSTRKFHFHSPTCGHHSKNPHWHEKEWLTVLVLDDISSTPGTLGGSHRDTELEVLVNFLSTQIIAGLR